MDISGKTILVLGGWGLVGSAVCRKLLQQNPACLIVTSLQQTEAEAAAIDLRRGLPDGSQTRIETWWGDVFARKQHAQKSREELLSDPVTRRVVISDTIGDLTDELLESSSLYSLLASTQPDAVIDCINTATAIAYQDIFGASHGVLRQIDGGSLEPETVERLLAALYVPQLIRHIQILYKGLKVAGTHTYIKIGTAGTGGMGLNIPYTHSEERPSRVLLSKSAVAGAHSLLLFLMARTPDGPAIKEIKPTATIAWKRIGNGEVMRRGKPIPLYDCPPEQAHNIGKELHIRHTDAAIPLGDTLKAPFIDTGENGIFARGEFEAISSPGQMEMITPEEIADAVLLEIKGGNSGHDIIGALDGAVYGPTYRGGFLRSRALAMLGQLEQESGIPSVAFEMLGPPRLSKLLFEAHILGMVAGSMQSLLEADPEALSAAASALIGVNRDLRSRIISIGIPILLPDGQGLLRAETIKIPPHQGQDRLEMTPERTNEFASAGWVDLRSQNMETWKLRIQRIITEAGAIPAGDTSSSAVYTAGHWENFQGMPPGKLVAWIFTVEDQGERMKA